MNTIANNVKNIIIAQLLTDHLTSQGIVLNYAADSSNQHLISVIIEIVMQNIVYEIYVSKSTSIDIHFKSLNGLIDCLNMEKIAQSLNRCKSNLTIYF